MNNTYDLLSKNRQIISTLPNYVHELKYVSDEVSQNDVSCMLYENIMINKIMESLTKVHMCYFYFNVGTYGIFPGDDDIHFNKLIKIVLEWYNEKLTDDLRELFEQDDILRFCIRRLFSYSKEKHTFMICIVSVRNHEENFLEKIKFWANPAPNSTCNQNGSALTIWGTYPIDIPNSFHINDVI